MVTPVLCEGGSHGSVDKHTAWEPEGPEYDSRQRQWLNKVSKTNNWIPLEYDKLPVFYLYKWRWMDIGIKIDTVNRRQANKLEVCVHIYDIYDTIICNVI